MDPNHQRRVPPVAEARPRDVAVPVAEMDRRPGARHRHPVAAGQQQLPRPHRDRQRHRRLARSAAAVLDLQLPRPRPDRLDLPPDRGRRPVPGIEADQRRDHDRRSARYFTAQRIAVLDRRVRRVEELEEVVGDARGLELAPERLRAEVEEELVALAAVDVDRRQGAQRVDSLRRHPHRVPLEPPRPDVLTQLAGLGVVGQLDGAVLVGRVAGRHAVVVEQHVVGVLRERRPRAEVLPEALERAVVVVAQRAHRLAELRQVADLEERVARVRGHSAEDVRPQQRVDHRAVAAARLAADPAVRGLGHRPVVRIDERHELVDDVRVVAARARRVDELAAAERRKRVDPDQDRRWGVALGEQLVHQLREVLAERRPVAPAVELPGQPLDHVDRRVPLIGVVVARRHVHPERPHVRVAERVVLQHLAIEGVLVEAAGELERPGFHAVRIYAAAGAGVTGSPSRSSSCRSICALTGACAISVPSSAGLSSVGRPGIVERPLLLNIA